MKRMRKGTSDDRTARGGMRIPKSDIEKERIRKAWKDVMQDVDKLNHPAETVETYLDMSAIQSHLVCKCY